MIFSFTMIFQYYKYQHSQIINISSIYLFCNACFIERETMICTSQYNSLYSDDLLLIFQLPQDTIQGAYEYIQYLKSEIELAIKGSVVQAREGLQYKHKFSIKCLLQKSDKKGKSDEVQ